MYRRVIINDSPSPAGIADLSVEYGSKEVGWLAYSGCQTPFAPETMLAVTSDRGRTWKYVQTINGFQQGTISVGGQTIQGQWQYEVPTLLHDPTDVTARRWKLWSHKIFSVGSINSYNVRFGFIAYRHAARPDAVWSPEQVYFGTKFAPPVSYPLAHDVTNLSPELEDAITLTEPGSLYHRGKLYICLTVITMDGPDRIILLDSEDHGMTWDYKGVLLSRLDALAAGYIYFDAGSMCKRGGRKYLMASGANGLATHNGTRVYEITSLKHAKLRHKDGALLLKQHIPGDPKIPPSSQGHGQATYHRYNATGIIQSQIDLRFPAEPMRAHQTFIEP